MMDRLDAPVSFETNPTVRAAAEKARLLFDGNAIRPQDFKCLYDERNIQKDLDEVRHLKDHVFENGSDKVAADILEGIIYEQIELADWFGPHAHTLKTSEYDDIKNGVDLVVELNEPERGSSHLALGVDATYGTRTIAKKFERIKRDIERDTLARIKYFESSDGRFKGALSQVPRVVLGVERDTILSLARLWTEKKNKELGAHPIQELLIKQTRSQLVAFREYARKCGSREAERAFEHALALVSEIKRMKASESHADATSMLANDRVHQEILLDLDMFGS